jgi:hypothetical protein
MGKGFFNRRSKVTRVKGTFQLFANGVNVAQWTQIPLVILAFLFSKPIAGIVRSMGFDFDSPQNLWFLEKQYVFFFHHNLVSPQVITALHIFVCLACLSIIMAVLRLISAPGGYLPSWTTIKTKTKTQNVPTYKFVIGWFLAGPGAIWASLDINPSSTILKPIIFSFAVFYIGFETLVFVFGTLVIVGGALICTHVFLSSTSVVRIEPKA